MLGAGFLDIGILLQYRVENFFLRRIRHSSRRFSEYMPSSPIMCLGVRIFSDCDGNRCLNRSMFFVMNAFEPIIPDSEKYRVRYLKRSALVNL